MGRSRGTPDSDQMESDDEYIGDGEEEEEEEEEEEADEVEDWDRRKRSDFAKRERRRDKAMAVKASTWIKAKDKDKRIKSKLICLSERGPRKTWKEAWKSLADECSVSSCSIRMILTINAISLFRRLRLFERFGKLLAPASSKNGLKRREWMKMETR